MIILYIVCCIFKIYIVFSKFGILCGHVCILLFKVMCSICDPHRVFLLFIVDYKILSLVSWNFFLMFISIQ